MDQFTWFIISNTWYQSWRVYCDNFYHTWISHKFHVIFKFNTSRRSKVREFNWIQYKDFWPKSCMTLTSSRENWLKVVIAHPLLIWALCVWILSQIWKGIGKISRTKSLQRFAGETDIWLWNHYQGYHHLFPRALIQWNTICKSEE